MTDTFHITVASMGRYQFDATGFRNKEHAQEVYALLVERFPPDGDFTVTVWDWTPSGSRVDWAPCDHREALGLHPPRELRDVGVLSTPITEQRERATRERGDLENRQREREAQLHPTEEA